MIAGALTRYLPVAALCVLLAGCGSAGTELSAFDLSFSHPAHATTPAGPVDDPTLFPDDDDNSGPATYTGSHLQCVPYAREHSGVNLHGDAYTWWDKAAGHYARGSTPTIGAVLVLNGYARNRAHVAVVRRLISPREIRIDHANWNDDGAIYVNDPVVDISADNDWSQVKVWNIKTGSWGTKIYNVQGFIGPGTADGAAVAAAGDPLRGDDAIALAIAATADSGNH